MRNLPVCGRKLSYVIVRSWLSKSERQLNTQIDHTCSCHTINAWPFKFQGEAKKLRGVYGDEIVAVEHVGSTSVPGMWAKPQIDILITVRNLKEVPRFYNDMKQLGYIARGDWAGEGEEYFTLDNAEGVREISVHIFPNGHRFATDLLDVRDYLRAHPLAMIRYTEAKREANQKYPADYTNYYKNKLAAIQEIRQQAAKWRGH